MKRPKNRIAILALPLLAFCAVAAPDGLGASNPDGQACHNGVDADRGKIAGISDPTKKSQAYGHLKAAYGDELAGKFADCLGELKAAEALMQ
ncbi:MAG TPA: hypothetical protein VHQ39_10390 [Dongiaceae bacterium]|jgi:hypothetical protein|nr:hypothetical protein [Dongiaceae bacterium]